jgi:hypothetical protein
MAGIAGLVGGWVAFGRFTLCDLALSGAPYLPELNDKMHLLGGFTARQGSHISRHDLSWQL